MIPSFGDYYSKLLLETPENKLCLMVYLEEPYIDEIKKLQEKLNIDCKDPVPKTKFHSTIRYMKTKKDAEPIIEWLKKQTLTEINGKVIGFERMNDAFVLLIESKEMMDWFSEANDWLVKHGYPKSDYPTFKPHLSLSYETNDTWKTPDFKKDFEIKLKFTKHVLTGSDYKVLWSKTLKND